MRYRNAKIKKDADGKRYYLPTMVLNIPLKDSDTFIFPRYGDRLEMVANIYYGDSNLWWIIAKANSLGKGKMDLDPTKKLRVPTDITDILENAIVNNF